MKILLFFKRPLLLACASVMFLFTVCTNASNRDGNAFPVNEVPADYTVFAAEVSSSPQTPLPRTERSSGARNPERDRARVLLLVGQLPGVSRA